MKPGPNAYYGWVPDRPDHRDKLYGTTQRLSVNSLPAKVDLRKSCPAVEDQGELGSCTAHALSSTMEFLFKKAGHRILNLSRLFIYYNERELEGTVGEDSGATLRNGIKTLVKQGACSEARWPYKIPRFTDKPTEACYVSAQTRLIQSYLRVQGLTQMKQCLADGYPFVFGFSVFESFESEGVAKTGTVPIPDLNEADLGGHAVMCVGYDDSTKRVMVRNSWGKDWGNKGYFTMPYEYISDPDLADDMWTIRTFTNV